MKAAIVWALALSAIVAAGGCSCCDAVVTDKLGPVSCVAIGAIQGEPPAAVEVLRASIEKQLIKAGVNQCPVESAPVIITGILYIKPYSESALGGYAGSGSGFLYGGGSAGTVIDSAIIIARNQQGELLITIAFTTDRIFPGYCPRNIVTIGNALGRTLTDKLQKR
jgi:hypothetical protein